MSFFSKLFGLSKKRTNKSCYPCSEVVCNNSPFYHSEVAANKTSQLIQYPLVFKAVDLICKAVANTKYIIDGVVLSLKPQEVYNAVYFAFLKPTYIAFKYETINIQQRTASVSVAITHEATAGYYELPSKKLNEIITPHAAMQLHYFYELVQSFYKSSKVAGILLPANTDSPNTISFTLNEQVELTTRLEQIFNDIRNSYNIISVSVPLQYVSLQRKFADTGLVELKTLLKEDIASCFGIPSLLLENNEQSTYNNLAESREMLQENLKYYIITFQSVLDKFVKSSKFAQNNSTKSYEPRQ